MNWDRARRELARAIKDGAGRTHAKTQGLEAISDRQGDKYEYEAHWRIDAYLDCAEDMGLMR